MQEKCTESYCRLGVLDVVLCLGERKATTKTTGWILVYEPEGLKDTEFTDPRLVMRQGFAVD